LLQKTTTADTITSIKAPITVAAGTIATAETAATTVTSATTTKINIASTTAAAHNGGITAIRSCTE
jgi:hypothetical protein